MIRSAIAVGFPTPQGVDETGTRQAISLGAGIDETSSPFVGRTLPNPIGPLRFNVGFEQSTNSLLLTPVVAAVPFAANEQPNPIRAGRTDGETRQSGLLPSIPPFIAQTDPNPTRRAWFGQTQDFAGQSLTLTPPVVGTPFIGATGPNPGRRAWSSVVSDFAGQPPTLTPPFVGTPFVAQTDLNPGRRVWSSVVSDFPGQPPTLTPPVVGTPFFARTDPNPVRRRFDINRLTDTCYYPRAFYLGGFIAMGHLGART